MSCSDLLPLLVASFKIYTERKSSAKLFSETMKSMNKDYKITVEMMRENLNKIKGNSEINFDFLDSLESFKNVTT